MQFMSRDDLVEAYQQRDPLMVDIEVFPNLFLAAFKSYRTGKLYSFELSDTEACNTGMLKWIVENFLTVGFNSDNYDMPLIWAAISGAGTDRLNQISSEIIYQNARISHLEKSHGFKIGFMNHIDLIEVAPAAAQMLGLKHYGARMHVEKLRELPIDPGAVIDPSDRAKLYVYNDNDLIITAHLYSKLKKAIDLRENLGLQYELDLRSCSDAQIAEKVISKEIEMLRGVRPNVPKLPVGHAFRYQQPEYIRFFTEPLQKLYRDICDTVFVVDDQGKIRVLRNNEKIAATNLWEVSIGNSKYTLGIGGLHSNEKSKTYRSNDKYQLFDRDVASYYPAIILNQGLYPKHIGPEFLTVYRDIVERRLQAKKNGDKTTANSLKITINGAFGKLGSKWSVFYSPDLLVQVTISGQLSLLMLIEMLAYYDIPVISANTDGIVIRCPQGCISRYLEVVRDWEAITGFETEESRYRSIHSRDVNNYIAIGEDGTIKAKGAYVNDLSYKEADRESLMKNPHASICSEAVMLFLRDGTPIEETVRGCKDVRKFLFVRRVNGGAMKDKQYLGKIVRWYLGVNEYGSFRYRVANAAGVRANVSESLGAVPVLEIGEMPSDIDYGAYIGQSKAILRDLGVLDPGFVQKELF